MRTTSLKDNRNSAFQITSSGAHLGNAGLNVHFPRGTKFGLLYGSANRDPEFFPNPDAFDVGRTPNRHLAFGGGVHFCLGNHLARQNMEVIFTTLLKRFSSIELAGEPEYKRGLSVRGPKALWIATKQAS